jgi:ABC-type phosphate/phosphonate transport system substrate-binding protein
MTINPIPQGTTRTVTYTIKFEGVTQDISADTVTLTVKGNIDNSDAQAVLQKDADVATDGADGVAAFELTNTETEVITPGSYPYDVIWYRGVDEEYLVERGVLVIQNRVSDV